MNDEFDEVPTGADEQTRQDIAARLAPYVQGLYASHPGLLRAPHTAAPRGERFVAQIVGAAMRELYNPAQLDVMQRVEALLRRQAHPESA